MKFVLTLLTSVILFAPFSQADSGVYARAITCAINGSPVDLIHIYINLDEFERLNRESGQNIFEKLVKKQSGDIKVQVNFKWGRESAELIVDGQYQYNEENKTISFQSTDGDIKQDLIYSREEESEADLFRLTYKNGHHFICGEVTVR